MELRILTNETLIKKFKSQFDLVNYAIRLAANMIQTGRDSRVKSDTTNKAMLILQEIVTGKDQFDEIIVEAVQQKENQREYSRDSHEGGNFPEKRKARRVLSE